MAWQSFNNKSNNSMILLSDGVANVGRTEAEDLLNETRKYAQKGITLSSIGVGMHNYNDVLLEKLGDKGNGFYAYIDDMDQARRVFNGNLAGALQLIARDVKIQVEFDPEQVYSYRLVGYENRAVNDYNFRNDRVDGGEIGPGHSVTALYEIYTKRSNYSKRYGENYDGNIGRVFIRYKNPESGFVEEINSPIKANVFKRHFNHSSSNLKLAACAAEFAEIMRDSYWARYSNLDSVLRLAKEVYHETEDPDVLELIQLVSRARKLRNLDSDYFSRE
jgi:Ca-activated chloride channel family protein